MILFCIFRGEWNNDPELYRLVLRETSELFAELCNPKTANGTDCQFPGRVTLETNLDCEIDAPECDVDTIRTVRVQTNPFPIYYEYVRQPCVEQAFFNDAKKVKDWTSSDQVQNSMCADTRRAVAAGK